ncbi:MAG: MoaD/ThiS family protein [Nitrospirae bacterium]|nr:MoaD/ThiS family protein [Nitrospirota bacterium]
MRVLLQHPKRETEIKGPRTVGQLLKRLNLLPEAVLVLRGDELVTEDEALKEEDTIEIRPVISGGCELHKRVAGGGAAAGQDPRT